MTEGKNLVGNLLLQITGIIKRFIGGLIGKINYVRNLKTEFNDKQQSKDDLLKEIEVTTQVPIKHLIKCLRQI